MNELSSYTKSKAYVELIAEQLQGVAPNRFSACLVNQIAYLPSPGINYPYQFIIPEIAYLENPTLPTSTKVANAFKRPEMKGLWKKHFSLPQHIFRNIYDYWKLGSKKSKKFEELIRKYWRQYEKDPSEENAALISLQIAKDMALLPDQDFTSGRRKKTGEYIIFQKHNGDNYYLCLAQHASDDHTLHWVTEAYKDFPFLQESV